MGAGDGIIFVLIGMALVAFLVCLRRWVRREDERLAAAEQAHECAPAGEHGRVVDALPYRGEVRSKEQLGWNEQWATAYGKAQRERAG